MRYIGIPACPYCRKRVNLIRTWSLKRQGEYQCPRCGGISNIFLSPLVYVLALLAVFGGGAMYFFYKFVLDDISLKTALYVFVPFAAFFLLSLFMVYLEKPVIKKVSKEEYNKRRGKREGAQAYDRTGDYQPEPNTGYLPRTGGGSRNDSASRRPEAAAPMNINQENFHKAKQQTASMNAVHESRGAAVSSHTGARPAPAKPAPAAPPVEAEPAPTVREYTPAAAPQSRSTAARRSQPETGAIPNAYQRASAARGSQPETGTIPNAYQRAPAARGSQPETGTIPNAYQRASAARGSQPEMGTIPNAYQRASAARGSQPETGTIPNAYQRASAARGSQPETGSIPNAYQRASAARGSQPETGSIPNAYQRASAARGSQSETGAIPNAYQRPGTRSIQGTAYQSGGSHGGSSAGFQNPAENQRLAQRAYGGQVPQAYAAYQPKDAAGRPRRSTRVTGGMDHPTVGGSIFEKYNDPSYGRHSLEKPGEGGQR
ncbi:hypothetical protein [Acutalibacter sp.]|uniref:hypothetical protein n=1 Tax=Acutalibacter sp. TaxID=1918636 RepID=UPI002172BB5E|nr:hypothetical protein [Acutalibacter sp.]